MKLLVDILNFIQSIANAIDWINVVTGAILGSVASIFPSVIRALNGIFRDQYKTYYGKYYIYNWAVSASEAISEKKLTISRDWRGYPKALLYIDEHVKLSYQGVMRANRRSLYFDLRGKGHAEELKIIFHEPLDKAINLLIGVFSATTLDSDPFAGKLLISKERLVYDDAKSYLGSRKIIIVDSKCCRKPPISPTDSLVFINDKLE